MPRKSFAPRLLSGDIRRPFGHGLPKEVLAGLRAIARREGTSMSWVLESAIIGYLHVSAPEYKRKISDVESARKRTRESMRFLPILRGKVGRVARVR